MQGKDLGYKRTPTDAVLWVTMPDHTVWEVPVQAIADSRDEDYAAEKEDTIGLIRSGQLDAYEITDWAANNMNWSDVASVAVRLHLPLPKVDYEDGWCSGEKTIKGTL